MNTLNNTQKRHYAKYRRNFTDATLALELARKNDNPCYTSELIWSFRSNTWNQLDKDGEGWIEILGNAGLRFVGYVDEIPYSGVSHTGWFIDDYQDETMRGVVVQRAGKNGKPIFIYGYECPHNENTYRLAVARNNWVIGEADSFNARDDSGAKNCAIIANSMAENDAKTSREYDDAYQNGMTLRQSFERMYEEGKDSINLIRVALDACRLSDNPKTKNNAISMLKSGLEGFKTHKYERSILFQELENERSKYDQDLLFSFNDGFSS